MTTYTDIQQVLSAAHSITDAAEAHGTLVGSLCATGAYRLEDWLVEILPEGQAAGEGAELLQELFRDTESALAERQMQFQPLLPEDAQSLDARTEALAQWCQGFLYGLGSGAMPDPAHLPGNVGEVVRDFSEITHASVDSADGDESNENAYAELVEFVRVGVQLLFEELQPLRTPVTPPPEGPLH